MERSETINTLLQHIGNVSRAVGKVKKTANNPFFKSKYVPLEKVQEVLAPLLEKEGLTISQPLYGKGITTIVSHTESGEWMSFPAEINNEHVKPQDQMSGVTYMKRYALVGLFDLQLDDDDDGNRANGNVKRDKEIEEIIP